MALVPYQLMEVVVINTNTASLTAQYHLSQVNKEMEQAMERLSSGQRITAADDAAGLAIVPKMDAQIRGLTLQSATPMTASRSPTPLKVRWKKSRTCFSVCGKSPFSRQTALTADRPPNLDAEVQQLKAEIDRVVDTTCFNDVKLLDGSTAVRCRSAPRAMKQ